MLHNHFEECAFFKVKLTVLTLAIFYHDLPAGEPSRNIYESFQLFAHWFLFLASKTI